MERSLMIAYTEVDTVLNLMEEQFQNKIPDKLRKLICENRLSDYDVVIDPKIPLKEQKISKRALSILAVLNYNYWCDDEYEKEKLIQKYKINEMIKQEKARELYNPDNLFSNKNSNNESKIENKELIVYSKKESFIEKLIVKIRRIFKLT